MKTDFAQMLSALRRERGISQKKAAKDLEISQALLSHYENGVREPKFEFIHKACMYYGVSADYILGRQNADSITVTCQSVYTMDMVNVLSELTELLDKMNDKIQASAAGYLKSVIEGVVNVIEDPDRPEEPEKAAKKLLKLAELYAAVREIKE